MKRSSSVSVADLSIFCVHFHHVMFFIVQYSVWIFMWRLYIIDSFFRQKPLGCPPTNGTVFKQRSQPQAEATKGHPASSVTEFHWTTLSKKFTASNLPIYSKTLEYFADSSTKTVNSSALPD